ncbi:AAA family ATPase [Mannheimia massilioguelmaensis]|uniref:AAA family ATPase n=1 Tax=Mannheimia massilioguelmaensis TaxID=1604354 RepID=UPI0005C8278C|nr:AAA family ATPase [Mannheimia massilioguelmaensis]
MSKELEEIAQELKNSQKKVQLIYAFNGTGKTRLSRYFKELIVPKTPEATELARNKILYYNAFTEDLFYWDNDLNGDREPKLKIQPNSFTKWVLEEQGQDQNIIANFQRYTDEKLTPNFSQDFSEVYFSFQRGDDNPEMYIKISKGEERNFVWSIFYTLLEVVISELNIPEIEDRSTNDFNELEYIIIDDPVSSLDENHLITLALDISDLIKKSESDNVKFIITTHNPLFYNVLHNQLNGAKKFVLEKLENGEYELKEQKHDSPFSYHLYLKSEIEKAIETDTLQKYHFNLLRNILEKTSTFLGYERWGELLPKDPDGSNPTEARLSRIINFYNHSKHSNEDTTILKNEEKNILINLLQVLDETYHFKKNLINENEIEK